jgi:hypothetical protein
MERTEIIQSLINKINAKKYLEIGVGPGHNFNNIKCEYKVCVEPNPMVEVTFIMTSDDFFTQNKEFFDVIFIDGLHESEQVYRDIQNSLKILNEGGFIVCHDMSPYCEIIQRYPQAQLGEWTGDCWKAWVKIRSERSDLSMYVVDSDYGCGVISNGEQSLITIPNELTWETLDNDRVNLLNLISVQDFKNKL